MKRGPGFELEEVGSVLRIAGELDMATAPKLADALRANHAEGSVACLDMRGVSFIDSSGVRVLLEAARRLGEDGGCLILAETPQSVMRVFHLLGVDRCTNLRVLARGSPRDEEGIGSDPGQGGGSHA